MAVKTRSMTRAALAKKPTKATSKAKDTVYNKPVKAPSSARISIAKSPLPSNRTGKEETLRPSSSADHDAVCKLEEEFHALNLEKERLARECGCSFKPDGRYGKWCNACIDDAFGNNRFDCETCDGEFICQKDKRQCRACDLVVCTACAAECWECIQDFCRGCMTYFGSDDFGSCLFCCSWEDRMEELKNGP